MNKQVKKKQAVSNSINKLKKKILEKTELSYYVILCFFRIKSNKDNIKTKQKTYQIKYRKKKKKSK